MVTKENQRFLLVYKVMNDIVGVTLTTRRITTEYWIIKLVTIMK
jgi:hypothetical protein